MSILKFSRNKSSVIYRTQKDNLKLVEAQEEQRMLRSQKEYLEIEVRKFRRKKLLGFHTLEQELLREVLILIEIIRAFFFTLIFL